MRHVQPIGKGQYRIKILNKRTRARLADMPGVKVYPDGRVCFPRSLIHDVLAVVFSTKKTGAQPGVSTITRTAAGVLEAAR
jgi:hypothetical protein